MHTFVHPSEGQFFWQGVTMVKHVRAAHESHIVMGWWTI